MSQLDRIFTQTCVCGRTFTGLTTFTRHEKGCTKGKKCLSGALSRAKEVYRNKKVRVHGTVDSGQVQDLEVEAPNVAMLSQRVEVEEESNGVCEWPSEADCPLILLYIGIRSTLNHKTVMILCLWPSEDLGAYTAGYQHATRTSYQSPPGCYLPWMLEEA